MPDIISKQPDKRPVPVAAIQGVLASAVIGFMAVVFSVAGAALVFSGGLERFLPIGIAIALASTAILAAVTGLMSSIRGLIALPQETTLALLAAIASSVALALPFSTSDDVKLATVICAIAIATIATGLVLFLLGRFRLGQLIRFIPVPVVGGFLAGAGCFILFGGLGVATGVTPSLDALHAMLKPHAVAKALFALVLAATLYLASNKARTPLAVPAIILLATILFHAIGQVSGLGIDDLTAARWFPNLPDGMLPWPPIGFADLADVDWRVIANQSFTIAAMMLVTAIAVLMNISSMETAGNSDADIEDELKASGLGNIASGALGGIAGFHGVWPTLLGWRVSGPAQYAGLAVAVVCIAALLFGGDLLVLMPLPVFGGLLIWVSITLLKQWLVDTYYQLTIGEYAIIVLMALVINAGGFAGGLITGLVAGIALFAIDYSKTDIVKTRLTGETFHSKRAMSEGWRALLKEHGGSIVILRLQGYIFFGTAHQFVEQIGGYLNRTGGHHTRYLVLDMRRTTGMDSSAAASFVKLEQMAAAGKFKLVLTDMPDLVAETLERAGVGDGALTPVRTFKTLDLGLLWCEEKLAQLMAPELSDVSSVSLKERFIDERFDEQAAQTMLKYMQQISLEPGDVLIEQGTESLDMYFIESGILAVELRAGDSQPIRLSSAGPGSFVGEISFYLGQQRSATVVCEKSARVWQLSRQNLDSLGKAHPEIATYFHQRMAVMLADRLSATTRLVQNLVD